MIDDEDERKPRRLRPPRRMESGEKYEEGNQSGDEARKDPRKLRTRRRASIGTPTIPPPERDEHRRGHIDRAKSAEVDNGRRARRGRRASMVSSVSTSDISVDSVGSYGYEDHQHSEYGYGDHLAPVGPVPGRRRGRRASISGPGTFPTAASSPEEPVAPSYDDKFGRSKDKQEETKNSKNRERRRPVTERSRSGQFDLDDIKSGDVLRESARPEPTPKADSLIMPITIPDAEKRPRRRASMLGAVGGAVGAVGGVVGSAAQKVGGAVIRGDKEKPRHRKGPEVDDIPKIAGNERRARGTMLDRLR